MNLGQKRPDKSSSADLPRNIEMIRQLKSVLTKAGFSWRPAKGSHTLWKHPALPDVRVTISGKDGDDTDHYLVEEVQKALKRLKGK